MKKTLASILLTLAIGLLTAAASHAQIAPRAYAPENLRSLGYNDQVRVISLEYSEQSRGRRIPDDQLRFYIDQVNRSNWGFSQIKQDIAQSLGGGNGGWPPTNPGTGTIRCESVNGRQQSCPTPWQGYSRLVRQISGTGCVEGQTWFAAPGSVRVIGGCRGEFAQGSIGGGDNREVRCESSDGRYRQCGDNLYGNARLVRQLSSSGCVQGSTWGLRNGSLWVDRGCRGIFAVDGNGWQDDYSVTCASDNGRYTTCAWDIRRGAPRLLQTLSKNRCTEGYSWGYSGQQGLWVNRGCRGRFGVR